MCQHKRNDSWIGLGLLSVTRTGHYTACTFATGLWWVVGTCRVCMCNACCFSHWNWCSFVFPACPLWLGATLLCCGMGMQGSMATFGLVRPMWPSFCGFQAQARSRSHGMCGCKLTGTRMCRGTAMLPVHSIIFSWPQVVQLGTCLQVDRRAQL